MDHSAMLQVHESWIYSMVVLGFIGAFILILLIFIAIYKTHQMARLLLDLNAFHYTEDKLHALINVALTFLIWAFNACACVEWALFRTDLFFDLNPTKCIKIYITNYMFYMIGKFCLHLLLLFRLYLAFHGTPLQVRNGFLRFFVLLISIDFIVFVSLWFDICVAKVSVGIAIPDEKVTFCTLYNNTATAHMSFYERILPLLFGAQDFVVGSLTLAIFVVKIRQLMKLSRNKHDLAMEALVRKLLTVCSTSICSTFLLFTFAIPFYSNLTFLLPVDAVINSFSVLLLLKWADPIYRKVCCWIDVCFSSAFDHENSHITMVINQTLPKLPVQTLNPDTMLTHVDNEFNLNVRDTKRISLECRSAPVHPMEMCIIPEVKGTLTSESSPYSFAVAAQNSEKTSSRYVAKRATQSELTVSLTPAI